MLHELLTRQAAATPAASALVCGGEEISYAALDRLADHLARVFRVLGVEAGDRVALWLDKSIFAVAAMQAALRIGAAYVPIDAGSPPPRVAQITANCEPALMLTTETRHRAVAGAADTVRSITVDGPEWSAAEARSAARAADAWADAQVEGDGDGREDELAYVLYTSGSTGIPKGVSISHRNALAFVQWAATAVGATATDRFANHAPFHFDLSVFDIYVAFAVGGSVALIPSGLAGVPSRLVAFLREHAITVWYSVPSALTLMMDHGDLLGTSTTPPRAVVFAGEAFPIGKLRELRGAWPLTRMFNFYGPTETNVCTAYEVCNIDSDRREPVPIGRPASGNRVWLEREDGGQPATDEVGEVIVSGPTVMLGYFGAAPHGVGPYRTGDLARRGADGELELIGRRDGMLKIRGHRIEPGEIENVLMLHPTIREVAVVTQGSGRDVRLVAVLVEGREERPNLLEIKRHCVEYLPRSMIVDRVRWVPALPRTVNGKIDRRHIAQSLHAELTSDATGYLPTDT